MSIGGGGGIKRDSGTRSVSSRTLIAWGTGGGRGQIGGKSGGKEGERRGTRTMREGNQARRDVLPSKTPKNRARGNGIRPPPP